MTIVLVGSRAALHHWPDFRQPKDIDVICTKEEARKIISSLSLVRIYKGESKWQGYTSSEPGALFVEMALNTGTHAEIYELSQNNETIISNELKLPCVVASPEILLLLKRSHVCFNVRWKKNFLDYQFMRSKGVSIPKTLETLLEKRIQETANRIQFRDPNFDVSNDEFFKRSERAIKRVFPHDLLHELIKKGKQPAYLEAKVNKDKVALCQELFFSLPYETQIDILQEEMLVLALERIIIPALENGHSYNARCAAYEIAEQMVVKLLPLWQRMFMVDNFDQVVNYKFDYVKRFLNQGNKL